MLSGLLIYVSTGVNELLPGWHRVVWFGVRFECIRRGGVLIYVSWRVNELLLDWKEDLDYISLSVLLIARPLNTLNQRQTSKGNKGNQCGA